MTNIFRESGEKIAPIKQKQNETKRGNRYETRKTFENLKKEFSTRFGWWNWWKTRDNETFN